MGIEIKQTRPYSSQGSHSVSDLSASNTVVSLPINTTLKRSKTVPNKREKFGEHEPQQVVFVNNNSSVSCKNIYAFQNI